MGKTVTVMKKNFELIYYNNWVLLGYALLLQFNSNRYDTKVTNLATILLFCPNVLHIFTKNADVSQKILPTICNFFIFSYDVA